METIVGLAVIATASFINTLTGFGFALVTVPGLGMVTDAKTAVVLTPILYAVLAPFFLWSVRKEIDRALFKSLLLSSLAGLPLGTIVLVLIDEGTLRLLIGAAIVLVALLMMANFQRPIRSRHAPIAVGFATGVLTTSIVVSGPPVVLFMANQGLSKEQLRATVGAFLLGMMPVSLVLYVFSGLVTGPTLITALKLGPALVVGYLLAVRTLPMVNATLFRRITVLLILVAGITMITSGLTQIVESSPGSRIPLSHSASSSSWPLSCHTGSYSHGAAFSESATATLLSLSPKPLVVRLAASFGVIGPVALVTCPSTT